MPTLIYTPDVDVKVHEEGAIRLICAPFQSHENGLPEWVKNAADEYMRNGRAEDGRIIVLILNDGRSGSASISCLDFSGMTSAVIENHFRKWADPDAAQQGGETESVQGGHGNGGKCYMCQMFDGHAQVHTVKSGLSNKYGVESGSVRFGYIPSKAAGRDVKEPNTVKALAAALKKLGCDLDHFPLAVQNAGKAASGFTLVSGFEPKGLRGKTQFTALVTHLQDHAQMIRSLEFCRLYVILNGTPLNGGKPLALQPIPPLPGSEQRRVVEIPEKLSDPAYKTAVSTTEDGQHPVGQLVLKTSDKSMRWSRKARHTVNFKAKSGYIGSVPVMDLDVQSPYRDNIYGECALDALERYKQNDRGVLADAPLTRAVRAFISDQISKYAKEFEEKEKKQYNKREKNELSKINEALDRWKNQFLNSMFGGGKGNGPGTTPPGPVRLPAGKVARVVIGLSHNKAGVGVTFKPSIEFYDAANARVRPVPFQWISDDTNVALVDDELGVLNTFAIGTTTISAQTLDGRVTSDKVALEVVHIQEIEITPNSISLPAGSRRSLQARCSLVNGEQSDGVYLEWMEDNSKVARVSAAGVVFGFEPGECKVSAGDNHTMAKSPAIVKVGPAEGKAGSNGKGRSYPRILVSSIDDDPDTKEPVNLSKDYPPVYQRPQDYDRNIWWINSSAPIATLFLDAKEGYGYQSREWRVYHLERYVEILIQIALTFSARESPNSTLDDYINQWGSKAAEIQAAAASSLGEFITDGILPTN
jgi:hypothetical protein